MVTGMDKTLPKTKLDKVTREAIEHLNNLLTANGRHSVRGNKKDFRVFLDKKEPEAERKKFLRNLIKEVEATKTKKTNDE